VELFLAVVLGAALAGFVQGLTGFGFSLTAMSLWAWLLEPQLAASLAVFGGLCGQVFSAATVRRGFDGRRLLPFLAGGAIGLPLGIFVLPHLDVAAFKLVLGGLLATLSALMLALPRLPRVRRGGRLGDALSGIAGGAMSGLGGFAGVVPSLWCTLRDLDKEAQRSVIQNFNLAMLAATFAGYLAMGIAVPAHLPLYGVVAPAVVASSLAGVRVYGKISEGMFRRAVLVLVGLSGAALLAAGLRA
jgi:hypothetical protein